MFQKLGQKISKILLRAEASKSTLGDQGTKDTPLDFPVSPKLLEGMSILVAEDHPDLQLVFARVFKKHGAKVDVVSNGYEAYHKTRLSKPYHVILLDLQMPIMDGYATMRALRKDGYAGAIAAITCGPHFFDEEATKEGFAEIIPKLIEVESLVKKISKYKNS